MSKKKKALIITSSVVGAILIAILALSLITVSPFTKLPAYDHVSFYDLSATSAYPYNENTVKKVDDGIKTTKFSIMHAMLEGRFDYGYNFKTYKDDDGETQRTEYSVSDIKSIAATDAKYMLIFEYKTPVTMKVEGEEIKFDRIKMLVEEFNGEVGLYELVPYLNDRIDNMSDDPAIGSAYYTVNPILVRGNSSKLMIALSEMKDALNGK